MPEIIKMLLGLLFIAPLLIGILFSFQSEQELGTYPLHLLSDAPTLQNYMEVIKAVPLFSYLLNSGIVCLVSIATQIVIACLAAYGFVFFEFPLKKLLFSLVLMTTMIPGRGSRDHELHNNSEPASDEYLRRTGGYFTDFGNVYFPDAAVFHDHSKRLQGSGGTGWLRRYAFFVSYYITDVQAHDFVHGGISVRSDLQSVFLAVTGDEYRENADDSDRHLHAGHRGCGELRTHFGRSGDSNYSRNDDLYHRTGLYDPGHDLRRREGIMARTRALSYRIVQAV